VRLLLDTHALLWALDASPRLSSTVRALLEDTGNEILVSAVSAWEIAVKVGLGRLEVPDDLEEVVQAAGFLRRHITFADAGQLRALPMHHRDPFDRMLIAQALVDGIPIASADARLRAYPVQLLW
jgi:PIN domain nuclease of toxin-antitoxin system